MKKRSNIDAAVGKLAQKQFGLISRAQALELGASKSGIHRRRAAHHWETVCGDVYRLAGAPASDHQRLMGVCLALGPHAFASHASAAHLWALDGFTRTFPRPFEVSVPHGFWRKLKGVVVHQRRDLVLEGVARFGEIPATGLARTLVDLATTLDAPRLEAAFDSAWRKEPALAAALEACLDALGSQGRTGVHALTGLLRGRRPRPTDSAHETDVLRAIRRARLPAPTVQHEIHDSAGRVARADFAWVGLPQWPPRVRSRPRATRTAVGVRVDAGGRDAAAVAARKLVACPDAPSEQSGVSWMWLVPVDCPESGNRNRRHPLRPRPSTSRADRAGRKVSSEAERLPPERPR